jgi:hypothetical protein
MGIPRSQTLAGNGWTHRLHRLGDRDTLRGDRLLMLLNKENACDSPEEIT